MNSGAKFKKRELDETLKALCENCELSYYQYPLKTKKEHYAHVFLCEMEGETELKRSWETVVSNVATSMQVMESLLERSNFYIFFFVVGTENKALQCRLEEDRYSSKKIVVFSKEKYSTEDQLKQVEQRIFDFPTKIEKCDADMLKSLRIKHFRSYLGEHKFDFVKNNNVARLVVLYAPNGYGKTSLFDAVEWDLTNEIDRFNDILNSDYGGKAIIKNLKAPQDERGFVELETDQSKKIKREIAELDTRSNQDVVRKAKVTYTPSCIEAEYGDVRIWKNIILQHHKIDGFISARKPTDLYTEWGSIWDPDNKIRTQFETKFRDKRKLEIELDKQRKNLEEVKNEYIKISNTRPFIEKLQKNIDYYNQLNQRDSFQIMDFRTMTAEEYMHWTDQVNIKYDFYTKEKEKIEEQIKYIMENLDADMNLVDSISKEIIELEESCQKDKVELEKVKKKKELIKSIASLQKKISELRPQLEIKEMICKQGMRWYDQMKKYFEQIEKYQVLLKNQEELQQNIITIEGEKEQKKLSLQKIEIEQEKRELYSKLNYDLVTIQDCKNRLKVLQNIMEETSLKFIEKKAEYEKNFAMKNRIVEFELNSLPHAYLLFQNNELEISDVDNGLVQKLKELEEEFDTFDTIEKKLKSVNETIATQEKLSEDWKQVVENGRKIIEKEKRNICPLCKTDWDSYEELLQHTYDKVEIISKETLEKQKKIRDQKDELEKIILTKMEEFETFRKIILEAKYNDLKEEKAELENLQKEIDNYLLEKEEKQTIVKNLSTEASKYIAVFSQESIEAWYSVWKKGIDKQKKLIEQEIEKKNNIIKTIQNTINLQAENIMQYEKNIWLIEKKEDVLVREKVKDIIMLFEFKTIQNDKDELEDRISKVEEEKRKKEEENEKYNDIDENMETEYQKKIAQEVTRISYQTEEKNKFVVQIKNKSGAKKIDKVYIKKQETEAKTELEKNSKVLDALLLLKYDKNVEQYFKNWKEKKVEYNELLSECDRNQKKSKEKDIEYQIAKTEIENRMHEFLQSVQINEVYRKIDPHQDMKQLKAEFKFNEKDKAELHFKVQSDTGEEDFYPEWYFSTAQLNAVAFSIFLGKALHAEKMPLKTIFIDDPVGHFDDMNIVGFADLLRNIIDNTDRQLIISTHEEKVFALLKRKLPDTEYDTKYIEMRDENTNVK